MTRAVLAGVMLAALAGCASYDGRDLVPGRSTGAEVETVMGVPAERLANADGGSTWFYARGDQYGRQTYAVTIGADGVMRGVERRLTAENVRKLMVGETRAGQVRSIFGPPHRITRAARKPLDVWEYRMLVAEERRVLWIEFSDDGVVRDVIEMYDLQSEASHT